MRHSTDDDRCTRAVCGKARAESQPGGASIDDVYPAPGRKLSAGPGKQTLEGSPDWPLCGLGDAPCNSLAGWACGYSILGSVGCEHHVSNSTQSELDFSHTLASIRANPLHLWMPTCKVHRTWHAGIGDARRRPTMIPFMFLVPNSAKGLVSMPLGCCSHASC